MRCQESRKQKLEINTMAFLKDSAKTTQEQDLKKKKMWGCHLFLIQPSLFIFVIVLTSHDNKQVG